MASRSQRSRERGRAASLFDRGDWGKRSMFFETEPHRWGFQHASGFGPSDPLVADPANRGRPKLGSFDASRPGLFAPRPFQREPFQRERRSSDGASCTSEEDRHSQASSTGSCGETEARPPPAQASSAPRERIIPIRIEGDDEEEKPKDPPPQRPLRKHERRDTVDGADMDPSGKERNGVEARDTRAQSCPVTTPPPNSTPSRNAGKFAPLKVNEALASQQREAQSPGGRASYQNISPKPFSPGSRPFKSSSFGMFGSPTRNINSPFGRGSEPSAPRPPPVPPKPSAAEIRAARQNSAAQQQHQQQNQQSSEQQKPQQPRSAKDEALSKIATIQADLDPLMHRLEAFNGIRGDKEYLYLDEMLTRGVLKLDGLETGGDADVRSARKEAIRRIQESLRSLERRSAQDATQNAAGDVQKSASVVIVNGVKMGKGVTEADRRATSAPPQGLARAEPVVIGGDVVEEDTPKRRVSAEEMGRR